VVLRAQRRGPRQVLLPLLLQVKIIIFLVEGVMKNDLYIIGAIPEMEKVILPLVSGLIVVESIAKTMYILNVNGNGTGKDRETIITIILVVIAAAEVRERGDDPLTDRTRDVQIHEFEIVVQIRREIDHPIPASLTRVHPVIDHHINTTDDVALQQDQITNE